MFAPQSVAPPFSEEGLGTLTATKKDWPSQAPNAYRDHGAGWMSLRAVDGDMRKLGASSLNMLVGLGAYLTHPSGVAGVTTHVNRHGALLQRVRVYME